MELPASRRLADVLDALARTYPGILGAAADYQWRHGSSHVIIAINGRVVDDESTDTQLADGDEVSLLPPLGGGCVRSMRFSARGRSINC
jgi:molybdopterin converting factor small subunit